MSEYNKKEIQKIIEDNHNNKFSAQSIALDRYTLYGVTVTTQRAIPDIRDGLKPVHRRILQSMKDLGLKPHLAPKKSARVVGHCLGIYHPHGDTAVYDAMVAMVQPWVQNLPLVNGKGNFGSIEGDSPAASRYTEAKTTEISNMFFTDMDKDIVNFKANYDDTEKEPEVLPVPFPNLLINGTSGIAVGMATDIPPHNPTEIMNIIILATELKKKKKSLSIEDVANIILGPDFPTGGFIYNVENMKDIIRTGKGKISIRAKHHIEGKGKKKSIVITEIPYQVNLSKLMDKIVQVTKDKTDLNINFIRNESSKEGIRVVIDLKSNANPEIVWKFLLKNTALDINYSYNMVALRNKKPQDVNFLDVINDFIDFRLEILLREKTWQKNNASSKLEITEGLLIALENINKVIKILKSAQDEVNASELLKKQIKVTDRQAKAIIAMKLGRLIGLEKLKLEKDRENLTQVITQCNLILNSQARQFSYLIKGFKNTLKVIDTKRKSVIDNSLNKIESVNIIQNEELVIIVADNYVRKITKKERENIKYKNGDNLINLPTKTYIFNEIKAQSNTPICFVTSRGKVYSILAHNIPSELKGRYIANIFEMENDEKIIYTFALNKKKESKLLFLTEKGFIKLTDISEFYDNFRKTGIIGIKLIDDKLVSSKELLNKDIDNKVTSIISEDGHIIVFKASEIPVIGRNSKGSIGMRNNKIVGGSIMDYEKDFVIVFREKGKNDRISLKDYKIQKRAGKGVLIKSGQRKGIIKKLLFS